MEETIDQQIARLQREKLILESQKKVHARADRDEYAIKQLNKPFMKYGGMNSCGSMVFEFCFLDTYDKNGCFHAKRIMVHLDAAAFVAWTNFNSQWSDPEYGKSGGTDKWQTRIEDAIFSRTGIWSEIEKAKSSNKYKKSISTNRVEINHYTPYNWDLKIENQAEWEYYWKEIPLKEWEKVLHIAEQVHLYIFDAFKDLVSEKAMANSGRVLLHPVDVKRSYEVIEKLDAFLNSPISKDFKNKKRAVLEILKT